MARQKSIEPLKRITAFVFEEDYARLEELFPTVGKQVAMRQIIRKFIEDWDRENGNRN
jgi:hypothetical protein